DSIVKEIVQAYPAENENVESSRLRYLNDAHTNEDGEKILSAVFICGFLILFMSCGIVSGLLTARYSTRTQEIAIRSALGGSRMQIVGQMIVEFLTISIPAVILGFLLSHWFDVAVLFSFYDRFQIPDFMRHPDATNLIVFVVLVLCFVSLVSTLMPALRASRANLNNILHESTRTGSSLRVTRMSNFLITWQVATACIVMSGGAIVGYFIYNYHNFSRTFNPADFAVARIAFNAHDHGDQKARNNEALLLVQKMAEDPGIEKACLSNEFFYGNQVNGGERHIWLEGKDYATDLDAPIAYNRIVSPGYMDALNIPIIAGRDFTSEDTADRPVTIVTEGFAREFFGSTDVLGLRFKIGKDTPFMTIVGIVPEIFNPDNDPALHSGFFRPYGLEPWDDIFIFVKMRGSFDDARHVVTNVIEATDARICLSQFQTFTETRGQNGPETFLEFLLVLFITFAICALVMTAGGLYGIISFSTNMRRTEMGIRLALGAKPSGLVLLMTRRGLAFVVIGLVLGIAGSVFLRNIMMSAFAGGGEAVWTYLLCALILIVISGVSIFIPAYGAANCDPSRALRD
ncbi:MAG TPA: FtsX-like permease family protein, partial [Opitutales bacterium]|nr:FtsX-like permease family protein [Opitutales bacterium]